MLPYAVPGESVACTHGIPVIALEILPKSPSITLSWTILGYIKSAGRHPRFSSVDRTSRHGREESWLIIGNGKL